MDKEADTEQLRVAQNKLIINILFSLTPFDAAVNKDNPIRGMTLLQVDGIFASTLKKGGSPRAQVEYTTGRDAPVVGSGAKA